MRNRGTGFARGQSCRIGVTGCMRATEQDFQIALHLEVVRDAIAAFAIAKEDLILRMFEMKVLHATSLAWRVEGVTLPACEKRHERLIPLPDVVD